MQVNTTQALSALNHGQKRLFSRAFSGGILFVLATILMPVSLSTAQDSGDESEKPKKKRDQEAGKGKKNRDGKPGRNNGSENPDGARRPGMPPGGPGRPGFGGPGPGGPGMGGPGMGMMMKFLPIMVALDADSNGELSTSEIENASKALLSLDKDGNGSITMEELRPDPSKMMANMPPEMRERMMERMKGEGGEAGKGKNRGDGNSDGSGVKPKRPE
ncbi:MAG: hypothetical protein ACOVQM_05845 [Pirellula sp.]|jgi:hypothetical protein